MAEILLTAVLAFSISLLFDKKIIETLPVAVFTSALAFYVFALVLPLNVAVWICCAAVAAFAAISLLVLKRQGRSVRDTFASAGMISKEFPSLLILIGICLIFGCLVSGHRVFYYDDLSYWGLYTKNIFCINKLPHLFENCSVSYKDYPPVIQILQFLVQFGRGTFSEGLMYVTNICFIYIVLLPILSHAIRKTGKVAKQGIRSYLPVIESVIMYVIFPHILTAQFYYRLGVDLFLGLVLGYVLYYIFVYDPKEEPDEWFRIIAITVGLSFLALIKTSGIVLCILAIIMFIINKFRSKEKAYRKYGLLKTAIVAVFTFGSYFSWQLFLRYTWNNGYLSNRVKDGVSGGTLSFPPYTKEVVLNYIKHFFNYPLTRNTIGVTAFAITVFVVLVHVIIRGSCPTGRQSLRQSSTLRESPRACGTRFVASLRPPADPVFFTCSMIGLLIFCLAHLSMYLFIFDEWEAHGLLEFDRYITQYLGGVFYAYVCLLLKYAAGEDGREDVCMNEADHEENIAPAGKGLRNCRILLTVSTLVFIALLPYSDMKQYLILSNYEKAFEDEYGQMSRNAQREWDESGIAQLGLLHDGTEKLSVVANAWDETTQFIEYVAVPQPINRIVNVPGADPGTINGFIMDFVDEYVYVCENAPASYQGDWDETREITEDGQPLAVGTLYKVIRQGDDKLLQIVY